MVASHFNEFKWKEHRQEISEEISFICVFDLSFFLNFNLVLFFDISISQRIMQHFVPAIIKQHLLI